MADGTSDMRANVTRAAEGFDRRSFTVAEILRMQDAGIISDEENYALIEGEIVPMHAKTHLHELIKSALTLAAARAPRSPLVRRRGHDLSTPIGAGPVGWRTIAERGRDETLTLAALPGFAAQLGSI